ncbi:MAG: glycyl-radical enzyme activating protein [Leptospiraceae bacterium]|nr:glycyl-radical enzyme activating protein [Leptospiraceae bacterium]MCK6382570.1 glycyl-radical enzyme activating protein [Leptospiraceae bacterium]NUM42354.1 glycyl-radical enzyme activating protein [Leptospiraceae bacterium]
MNEAAIFEIKGHSLDDGPGIRTVIFFKGCPLSCVWCHNPESKKAKFELSFYLEKCSSLGNCLKVCPENALDKNNPNFIDRDRCTSCFKCVETCDSGALSIVGENISVEKIISVIENYIPFYESSGGGVTLSGGEFSMYPNFCENLLKEIKKKNIHVLIETSGQFNFSTFEKSILPYIDQIYYDIKIYDEDHHKKFCGISNKKILDNFEKLHRFHIDKKIHLTPRTPLVPNITATKENLEAIANFYRKNKVKNISLLPYNPLWSNKSGKLGISLDYKNNSWMTKKEIEDCRLVFQDFEIV